MSEDLDIHGSLELTGKADAMSKAIETLMQEHRLIERVLGSLETLVERVREGADIERATVARYARFFGDFADKCHHGKEEDRLFRRLAAAGFPRRSGPLAVMHAEHDEGRGHVASLGAVGGGSGPLSDGERESVVGHGQAYVTLLRAHIRKEDGILFPMAERALTPDQLEELAVEFDVFESSEMGDGAHERLQALAEQLVSAYPPEPEKSKEVSTCGGCGGPA